MKKRVGKIVLSLLLVLTILAISGCDSVEETSSDSVQGKSDTSDEKLTVRVGEMRLQYPIKAAKELGYFEEAFGDDVEVKVYNFASGSELIQALAAGEIDLTGSFGSTPVIAGIANGYPITIINGTTTRIDGPMETYAIVTNVDSGIDSIEDLTGHSFLLAGNVDAAVTCEPYIGKLVDTGNFKTIGWISEYNAGGGLQIANTDFAKEYPNLVQNFLKAYIEVKQWAHENEENENTVLQIVADQIGIEPSDVKSSFDNDNVYFGLQDEDIQIIQDNIPYLLEKGTITKEVILSDYVDYSFLEAIGYKDYYLQFLES